MVAPGAGVEDESLGIPVGIVAIMGIGVGLAVGDPPLQLSSSASIHSSGTGVSSGAPVTTAIKLQLVVLSALTASSIQLPEDTKVPFKTWNTPKPANELVASMQLSSTVRTPPATMAIFPTF